MTQVWECKTRREAAQVLEDAGVFGDAAEQILRETAGRRHEWRSETALESARAWVREKTEMEADLSVEMGALCVLLADMGGPGGPQGIGGGSTSRHPAFGGCGKGRKQASDGDAWTAAIRDAAEHARKNCCRLAGCPEWTGYVSLEAYGCEGGPSVSLFIRDGDGEILGSFCLDAVVGDDWLAPLYHEGLRQSLGLGGWFNLPVFVTGDPASWSAAVNGLRKPEAAE